MNTDIVLTPQAATPALLDELEARGLIIRIAPRRHEIPTQSGEALGRPVYPATDPVHGGHLLLACTINQTGFNHFGWHPVSEEFLLLGPGDAEPLYLAIFLGTHEVLAEKIAARTLTAGDFTCLHCKFNDPETSFFTMCAGVPHGECVARTSAHPPSFYVTEPDETSLLLPDWHSYRLRLEA